MSVPSKKMIESEISKLRAIVEVDGDPVLTRIAYAVENALRWAIEDTVGWQKPSQDVFEEAHLLHDEMKKV
jgi:hypothetical protein